MICIRHSFFITLTILLCSCGGGRNSDQERDTAQGRAASDQTSTTDGGSQINQAQIGTDPVESSLEITAQEDFLLESKSRINLVIDIPALSKRRAYLSLCHLDNEGVIDYQNCMLRTPLRNGILERDIVIANDIETLKIAIWLYSLDDDPLEFQWQRAHGQLWHIQG